MVEDDEEDISLEKDFVPLNLFSVDTAACDPTRQASERTGPWVVRSSIVHLTRYLQTQGLIH